MGLLADFFIATPEQAFAYRAAPKQNGLLEPEDLVEYGDFTEIHLEVLWALLEEGSSDQRHKLEAFDDGEGETWLAQFPQPLVLLLAELDDERLTRVQRQWAQDEDMHCQPEALGPVLQDLRRLAQRALAQDKGLYLWGSL